MCKCVYAPIESEEVLTLLAIIMSPDYYMFVVYLT